LNKYVYYNCFYQYYHISAIKTIKERDSFMPTFTYPHPIRLIALDLDGTVFNDKKEITPCVQQTICTAISRGILVMPATGRPEAGLPEEFLSLPGVQYALTSNGARILDIHTKKVVYEDLIPLQKTLQIIDFMAERGYIPDIYINGEVFVQKDAYEKVLKEVNLGSLLPYFLKSRQPVDNLRSFIKAHGKDAEKLNLMIENPVQKEALKTELHRLSDIAIFSGLPNNIEITAPTVNKGDALLAFGRQLDIKKEEIMACGDSGNDLDMIRAVGLGIAMGNASEQIKSAASYITKTNEEDGVAYAIQKFCLP